MLTRIYGTAFFDQAGLDEYLERLRGGPERDHRRLGRELDLFHFSRGLAGRRRSGTPGGWSSGTS